LVDITEKNDDEMMTKIVISNKK